ncbi:MAG TPA: radical SAM protein [Thermoanaerobaculia bacterium]|nr:radical SAM protein [Thermoanaerobaculia bacterium]
MFSGVELEIELFCRGMRVDAKAGDLALHRTRAGLGSGLEIVLMGGRKPIWVNVPVTEAFAAVSPYRLTNDGRADQVVDDRSGDVYPVSVPREPEWYSRPTQSGVPMSRIGVLQGNYLGIYVSTACLYWASSPSRACKFCTTGKNVGFSEQGRKKVEDVVEVARAARDESGAIFTHLNTGYHFEDVDRLEPIHGLRQCEPFVRALRREVGGFIGVQAMPVPKRMYAEYDALIDAGADHFSFCYEFEDPEWFSRICPGKAETHGQRAFFDAMEYTAKKLGRGRVSGEIIAGLEPITATMRGIDRIVEAGAFPTVCIFRPTEGSALEGHPSPDPAEMRQVFAHLYEACRDASLPIGILPIEVSLVVQAEEASVLVPPSPSSRAYEARLAVTRALAKPYVAWKKRPRAPRERLMAAARSPEALRFF